MEKGIRAESRNDSGKPQIARATWYPSLSAGDCNHAEDLAKVQEWGEPGYGITDEECKGDPAPFKKKKKNKLLEDKNIPVLTCMLTWQARESASHVLPNSAPVSLVPATLNAPKTTSGTGRNATGFTLCAAERRTRTVPTLPAPSAASESSTGLLPSMPGKAPPHSDRRAPPSPKPRTPSSSQDVFCKNVTQHANLIRALQN